MMLVHCITLGSALFILGILSMLMNRRNMVSLLIALELMLLGVNINFVSFARFFHDIEGQIFTFIILAIAAAEAAIGLALLLIYFRNKGEISVDNMTTLKG